MIHLLFTFVHLVETTQAASANSTSSSCHPVVSGGTTRTLWSILGSCLLTLIICVWQAIHPNFPPKRDGVAYHPDIINQVYYALTAFLFPEGMVRVAASEWSAARTTWENLKSEFHQEGYLWSMRHCLFADMGGFVYCDESGSLGTIDSHKFLELCSENKIANPIIAEKEIKALSKSDWFGKTVLGLQLLWFILQVSTRHFGGLAITLVELDTLCMAVLTLVFLFFWWKKPLRPTCPHMFYSPQCSKTGLSQAWVSRKPEHRQCSLEKFIPRPRSVRIRPDRNVQFASLCATWFVFGVLHLTAWNFSFVTKGEKTAWHVASGLLTASPLLFVCFRLCVGSSELEREITIYESFKLNLEMVVLFGGLCVCVFSRYILVFLILYSLRSIPCSAYEVVPWTSYIPHLRV